MRRRLITVLIALLVAAVGAAGVYQYARDADSRAVAGHRGVTVLVAARPIPAGTAVSDLLPQGYLKTEQMPAQTVPADAITGTGGYAGRHVVPGGILEGALIRGSMFTEGGLTSGLSVPPGKLALTVLLTDEARVAGYAQSGSTVAIFLGYKLVDRNGKALDSGATGSRLLMSGVPVLAVGPAPGRQGSTAQNGALVTLGVTQHQAEQLVWASAGTGAGQTSSLYLALQTSTSQLDPAGKGVSSFALFP